jgi:hypothetical protein
MYLRREVYSDTMGTIKKPSVKPLCQCIKAMAIDLPRSDGQRI